MCARSRRGSCTRRHAALHRRRSQPRLCGKRGPVLWPHLEQRVRAPVDSVRAHDVVASRAQRQQRGGDGLESREAQACGALRQDGTVLVTPARAFRRRWSAAVQCCSGLQSTACSAASKRTSRGAAPNSPPCPRQCSRRPRRPPAPPAVGSAAAPAQEAPFVVVVGVVCAFWLSSSVRKPQHPHPTHQHKRCRSRPAAAHASCKHAAVCERYASGPSPGSAPWG